MTIVWNSSLNEAKNPQIGTPISCWQWHPKEMVRQQPIWVGVPICSMWASENGDQNVEVEEIQKGSVLGRTRPRPRWLILLFELLWNQNQTLVSKWELTVNSLSGVLLLSMAALLKLSFPVHVRTGLLLINVSTGVIYLSLPGPFSFKHHTPSVNFGDKILKPRLLRGFGDSSEGSNTLAESGFYLHWGCELTLS